MSAKTSYTGVSWDDMNASRRDQNATVKLESTGGEEPLSLKIVGLGDFGSNRGFMVQGRTERGKVIILVGRASRQSEQAATYTLVT